MKWAVAAPLLGLALTLGGCAVVPLDYEDGADARSNFRLFAR
jgi:hypothetical protein